jgi:putative FmdB family regulatory protein
MGKTMIYEFKCECGRTEEAVRSVEERNNELCCPRCGRPMKRMMASDQIYVQGVQSGRIPGVCHSLPGGSVYVKSKAAFKDICKQRGCEPVNL